jgi:hypothetical protein
VKGSKRQPLSYSPVLSIKDFTLTHLSPLNDKVVSQRLLKAENRQASSYWRIANMERCKNPWHDCCRSSDIEVYIQFKGEKLPICKRCWGRIAERDLEW